MRKTEQQRIDSEEDLSLAVEAILACRYEEAALSLLAIKERWNAQIELPLNRVKYKWNSRLEGNRRIVSIKKITITAPIGTPRITIDSESQLNEAIGDLIDGKNKLAIICITRIADAKFAMRVRAAFEALGGNWEQGTVGRGIVARVELDHGFITWKLKQQALGGEIPERYRAAYNKSLKRDDRDQDAWPVNYANVSSGVVFENMRSRFSLEIVNEQGYESARKVLEQGSVDDVEITVLWSTAPGVGRLMGYAGNRYKLTSESASYPRDGFITAKVVFTRVWSLPPGSKLPFSSREARVAIIDETDLFNDLFNPPPEPAILKVAPQPAPKPFNPFAKRKIDLSNE